MKRSVYILSLMLIPIVASAQKYSLGDLSVAGDKAMLSLVGDDIFNHSKFDVNVAYSYNKKNEEVWAYVKDHGRVKYKPNKIIMRYQVAYHYDKCAVQNYFSGFITLEFDRQLQLINTPDLSFLPDFVLKNEKCNYLTRDEAKAVIKREKFPDEEMPDMSDMGNSISNGKQQLAWGFSYSKQKEITVIEEDGKTSKQHEQQTHMVQVDAETGKIIMDFVHPKFEDVIDKRKEKK